MDISYLLLLQDFRNRINDSITPFMLCLSDFAVVYLVLIPAFVYWCLNKRSGLVILAGFSLSRAVNAFLKLTACVYRPWIRDPRVLPYGDAKITATGYSFPSGHSTSGTALYGGLAIEAWKNKKLRFASIIFAFMIAATLFSRNYLGVHTPQDVIVGFLSTALVLFAVNRIAAYLDNHPEKENYFLLGGIVLVVILLFYFMLKSYPEYYVDGKKIVDPAVMKRNGFTDTGSLAFFCIARFIEKKWVRFEAAGLNVKGVIVSLLGFIPYLCIEFLLKSPCYSLLGQYAGRFIHAGLLITFIVLIWPLVIKLVMKQK